MLVVVVVVVIEYPYKDNDINAGFVGLGPETALFADQIPMHGGDLFAHDLNRRLPPLFRGGLATGVLRGLLGWARTGRRQAS